MKRLLRWLWVLALLAGVPAHADRERCLCLPDGRHEVTVSDSVLRTEVHAWRFEGRAGQSASLRIEALEHNAAFEVWRPGAVLPADPDADISGQRLTAEGQDTLRWKGRLPETGSYLVVVAPTRGNASYRLTLKMGP